MWQCPLTSDSRPAALWRRPWYDGKCAKPLRARAAEAAHPATLLGSGYTGAGADTAAATCTTLF